MYIYIYIYMCICIYVYIYTCSYIYRLPNGGIDYYISPAAVKSLTALEKPYIVSLSGLSLTDNLEMLGRAMATPEISAIELNLACPNIPGKPTIAYDFV
jgi:dihydroorotate dehydrogenase (fumarate)